MKILVTGGHGLIGHQVVAALQRNQHLVSVIDNHTNYGIIPRTEINYLLDQRLKKLESHVHYNVDIADSKTTGSIITHEAPELIVHLASFPRQKVVNSDPAAGSDVMMRGLINLLESAKKNHCKRFVYVSSSMVYGDFRDQVNEDAVCQPQGQYGIMKLAGEWLVKDYAAKTGMEFVILRPSAVYGPLDVEDRVIAKFMIAAMQNHVLKINGPEEKLDFTYVSDAADGIVKSVELPQAAGHIFNITKSHSVSLLQAAEKIVSLVGKGHIEIRSRDLDFPSRGALNIDKARKILNFNPAIDVDQGFKEYYQWLSNSSYWQHQIKQC